MRRWPHSRERQETVSMVMELRPLSDLPIGLLTRHETGAVRKLQRYPRPA